MLPADLFLKEKKMKIFVYGTLKHGQSNWRNFLAPMQPIASGAVTTPDFALTGSGIPYMHRTAACEGLYVKGDVFEVDVEQTLLRLHQLEEHPNHYRLERITLRDYPEWEVYAYIAQHAMRGATYAEWDSRVESEPLTTHRFGRLSDFDRRWLLAEGWTQEEINEIEDTHMVRIEI